MSTPTGTEFASVLHGRFATTRDEATIAATQGEWTAYMFGLLADVAEARGLWWAGNAAGLEARARRGRKARGQCREYLWDFTMYAPDVRGVWNLPCVVVEHENVHKLDAFRFDHWKTLLAVAPLRVAIGYCPHERDREAWVEVINEAAEESANAWGRRRDGEDLIALGYWRMTDGGNFRFWHRPRGTARWSSLAIG